MRGVRIVGMGRMGTTRVGKLGQLASDALALAVKNAGMDRSMLQGVVAVPEMKLLPSEKMVVRTIDKGGEGPISGIITAANMIQQELAEVVAVVATDAVMSLQSDDFAQRANSNAAGSHDLASPSIPHGFDRIAQWQMKEYGVTREQLAMVPVILSHFAAKNPMSMCSKPYTLNEVLQSQEIAPVTSLKECARRADGAACVILASERHYKRLFPERKMGSFPAFVSGGEASGPLYPPAMDEITEDMFSCEKAAQTAYKEAHMTATDIDFFGLYDCFPICFLRSLEAVQLCKKGEGGAFIEDAYKRLQRGVLNQANFPINTHGGLQCLDAPWEVPAMCNIWEAGRQLQGNAGANQIHPKPRKALVYGNGGIFSASAVVVLSDGVHDLHE